MKSAKAPCWLVVVGLALGAPLHAEVIYQVTDMGTLEGISCLGRNGPPAFGKSSFATAVDAYGRAAGGSCAPTLPSGTHAFFWNGNAMVDVGNTASSPSEANGMNDAGQLVGESYDSPAPGQAFVWSGGVLTSLTSVLGGFSAALDINNSGQIVGLRGSAPRIDSWEAFLYDSGSGAVTSLPGLGDTFRTAANAINDLGVIAGYGSPSPNVFHAARWTNGTPTDLGTLGGLNSFAHGLNAVGDVVGESWVVGDTDTHAFIHQGGSMKDLGTLGGGSSAAFGIDDAGVVVGTSSTGTAPAHAFVYSGGTIRDLNDLIAPDTGFVLERATGINASGEIVGVGRVGGEQHAFLVSPGRAFFTLAPCRLVDTRDPAGPRGGPALAGGGDRSFALANHCDIPLGAKALSANLTVTGSPEAGDLRAYPGDAPLPLVSSINYGPGQTRANDAVLRLGATGELSIHCDQASGSVHFILDVNGYFK